MDLCGFRSIWSGSVLATGHKNIFSRIWQGIKDFFDRVFNAIGKFHFQSGEAQLLDKLDKRYKKLEKTFVDILRSIGTETNSAEENLSENKKEDQSAETKKSLKKSLMDDTRIVKNHKIKEIDFINDANRLNQKILENMKKIAKMEAVYHVDRSRLERSNKTPKEIFTEFFNEWQSGIYSNELGMIDVRPSSVRSEIRHGITAEKIASIEAIPEVIKKGEIIFVGKKSEYTFRVVICAPITIGLQPYYMGVMLQRDSQNQRLYLHNLVIEKEASQVSHVDLVTTGTNETRENLSITSIIQNALKVKYQNNKNSEINADSGIKKSLKDTSSVETRESIAEAFKSLAATDGEKKIVKDYAKSIEKMDKSFEKKKELFLKLQELKGKTDSESKSQREKYAAEIQKINDDIVKADESLLKIAAAEPFRSVVRKYQNEAYNKGYGKGIDAREGYILKTVAKVTKRIKQLCYNTKQKNSCAFG